MRLLYKDSAMINQLTQAQATIEIFMRLLWCQHPSWYISSLIWKGDSSHFLSLPQSGGRRVVMRLKIISILIFSDADQICVFLLKITKTLHMGHQGKSLYNTMFLLSKILQCSPQKKHINESFSLTLAKILNKGLDKQTLDCSYKRII